MRLKFQILFYDNVETKEITFRALWKVDLVLICSAIQPDDDLLTTISKITGRQFIIIKYC